MSDSEDFYITSEDSSEEEDEDDLIDQEEKAKREVDDEIIRIIMQDTSLDGPINLIDWLVIEDDEGKLRSRDLQISAKRRASIIDTMVEHAEVDSMETAKQRMKELSENKDILSPHSKAAHVTNIHKLEQKQNDFFTSSRGILRPRRSSVTGRVEGSYSSFRGTDKPWREGEDLSAAPVNRRGRELLAFQVKAQKDEYMTKVQQLEAKDKELEAERQKKQQLRGEEANRLRGEVSDLEGYGSRRALARAYGQLAAHADNPWEKVDCYRKQVTTYEALEDTHFAGRAINSLANCLLDLGEFDESLLLHSKRKSQALSLLQAAEADIQAQQHIMSQTQADLMANQRLHYAAAHMISTLNVGRAMEAVGRGGEAAEEYLEAIDLAMGLEDMGVAAAAHNGVATVTMEMVGETAAAAVAASAQAAAANANAAAAAATAQAAADAAAAAVGPTPPPGTVRTTVLQQQRQQEKQQAEDAAAEAAEAAAAALAGYEKSTGNVAVGAEVGLAKAERHLNQGVYLAQQAHDMTLELMVTSNLGLLCSRTGRYQEALDQYERVISRGRRGRGSNYSSPRGGGDWGGGGG